ncbi:MAG TPA: hypothetical protein DCG57_01840 [Candidatus Riflebacteria bacterium]|jgi:ABC-type molybdate transport system substrate-binding protein|nr:hypothetical protein [Candidatus Riflebacteria bacterium]
MRSRAIFMIIASVCLLTGCCAGTDAAKPTQPEVKSEIKQPLSQSDQMRQKAKVAEAASLIGYDGKAINRDLNKIIDEQERSAKQLEELNGL